MKQAIMIGAGNIGRGFIGAILANGGYHVTFADVNMELIGAINEAGKYSVHVQDKNPRTFCVAGVDGVSSAGDALIEPICTVQLITTAVGLRILPVIAKPIAAGIRARMAAKQTQPLNIIACENAIRATSQLKTAVYALLDEETKLFADANIGFADCAVDRIVPKAAFEAPLDVAVEEFSEWDVERSGWKGELPQISGMTLVDNLDAYIERKLFTLNSGHAVCAYLGCLRGHKTILESIQDPAIGTIVYQAMQQSGAGLVKKYSMDAQAHQAYIDRIFARFHNPYLHDEVARVGREPIRKLAASDRLISPLRTAYGYGLPVDELLFGAAAALRYKNAEDPQSTELQETIASSGAAAALAQYSKLPPEHPLSVRILDSYRALGI